MLMTSVLIKCMQSPTLCALHYTLQKSEHPTYVGLLEFMHLHIRIYAVA